MPTIEWNGVRFSFGDDEAKPPSANPKTGEKTEEHRWSKPFGIPVDDLAAAVGVVMPEYRDAARGFATIFRAGVAGWKLIESVMPLGWGRGTIHPSKPEVTMGRDEALSVLGLHSFATEADIRKAFARCANERHPDRGGSNEGFQRLLRARKVLLG